MVVNNYIIITRLMEGEIDINKDTFNGVIDTEEPVTNTDFIDDDDCESCKI